MHSVKPDRENNRLYITIGEADRAEIEETLNSVKASCQEVTAGFTCIFHFPEGALILPSDQDLLFKIQEALVSGGIKKAVYVRTQGSVLGRLQLEMLHMNSSCPAEDALSLDEAEMLLNGGRPTSASFLEHFSLRDGIAASDYPVLPVLTRVNICVRFLTIRKDFILWALLSERGASIFAKALWC